LRIIGEGDLGAGDEIRVIHRPDHDLTIRDVLRIYTRDRDEVERIIATPQISDSWKKWAETLLQKSRDNRSNAAAPSCC
jgi:MOSC domain-containing protein YiiM